MDDLLNIVSKLNQEMSNYIIKELEEKGYKGLALSHGKILVNFFDKEEMNYKELSRRINKSPQTMTTLVRKLEKEGFIRLKTDPNDKRNKLVSLTEEGKALLPTMMKISNNLFEVQYQGLSKEEIQTLRSLLYKVINNF